MELIKYFIDSKVSIKDTTDLEKEMTRRMVATEKITKDFKTEFLYYYADRVGTIMVVDVDDANQLSEIVLLLHRAGLPADAYPLTSEPGLNKALRDMAGMD